MTVKVETLIIMETNQNFMDIFRAMFIFDSMMSNGAVKAKDITDKDMDILNSLIINRDNEESSQAVDPYIASMLDSYIRTKQHVIINLERLHDDATNKHYGSFILDKLECIKKNDYEVQNENDDVKSNLISPNIFKILPNIKSMVIDTSYGSSHCYPFNMFSFIDTILVSSTIEQVKIHDITFTKNNSWIGRLWSMLSRDLKDKCKEKGLIIQFVSIKKEWGDYYESLSIERV